MELQRSNPSFQEKIVKQTSSAVLKRTGLVVLLVGILLTLGVSQAFGQDSSWRPQKTWVFVVGAIRFKHKDMFGSFPQENRRDAELVTLFKERGVPASHVVYLRDREATEERIQSAFTSLLARSREGDMLFLYYTGHGYKSDDGDTYLASYDAGDDEILGWSVDSIPKMIDRNFRGSSALLTLDNCYSGALAETVLQRHNRVSYAVLTSSTSDQSSTGEWTFTEGLLDALRGKAYEDTNGDGRVTLAELAGQVKDDMTFTEKQNAVFTTTGDFDPQMVLSRAEEKSDSRIGERVTVKSEGSWYKGRIIDADREESQFLVHYYGFDESYDEWVAPSRIRGRRITPQAAYRRAVSAVGR
jgi:hypothetical protein